MDEDVLNLKKLPILHNKFYYKLQNRMNYYNPLPDDK
jgi:hypothetical protein